MAKKKILIQLSDEDSEFFSDLLARDDIEIVSDDSDAKFTIIEQASITELITKLDKVSEDKNRTAHELKNPLASIKGYTDVLLSGIAGELTEQQANFLQTIKLNANRMQPLIDDMRDSVKTDAGLMYVDESPFDIEKAIKNIIPYIHKLINQEVKVNVKIDRDLMPGYADEERFQSVISRLFKILFEHSSSSGTYEIIATHFSHHILIKLISTRTNADIDSIRLAVDAQGFERDFGLQGIGKWGGHVVDVNSKSVEGIQLHFTIPIAKEDSSDSK